MLFLFVIPYGLGAGAIDASVKKIYARYDKSALQWNKFVKVFCADDATKEFRERLKAAAIIFCKRFPQVGD